MIRRLDERRAGRVVRQGARADLGAEGAADPDVRRRLRPEGARRRRPGLGRRDHPARRPGDHRVDHVDARASAEKAGRDPAALECIVGAPSKVSDDLATCREEVRWFPAMVSNHVMDLIERYGWDSDIPSELTDFVKTRKVYDYKDHSRVGAAHGEFVTDEICDRFCVIGSAEAVHEEAPRARGRRGRPVQHLPDDERPGRDARRLRPGRHPAVRGRLELDVSEPDVVLGQRRRGCGRGREVAQLRELERPAELPGVVVAVEHRGHPVREVLGPPDAAQARARVAVERGAAAGLVPLDRSPPRGPSRRRSRGSAPSRRSAGRCAPRRLRGTGARAASARPRSCAFLSPPSRGSGPPRASSPRCRGASGARPRSGRRATRRGPRRAALDIEAAESSGERRLSKANPRSWWA